MNAPFSVRLAVRESRHALRRVGVYVASIALGVGSLVAIHSFRDDVARAVRSQADALLGSDVRLEAQRAFPDSVEAILDSLALAGARVARVTTVASMVRVSGGESVRLLQVRGVRGGYPFYGEARTVPAEAWRGGPEPGRALVDPAVLSQLRASVGDTLDIGRARVLVAGTIEGLPTDLGFQSAIGPRVYVAMETLRDADLLSFGSLARYEAHLLLPDRAGRDEVWERHQATFRDARVRYTSADEQARRLTNGVRFLGRFLSLVGLAALLLGGVGVASAIHVYVRERLHSVAVLRCLGADQGTVFAAYLLQAAALGLVGATLGVALGAGAQRFLPLVVGGALPVTVEPRFSPAAALAGLSTGVWVAAIFALVPLLDVRDVPPLRALRQDVEGRSRRNDPARVAAWAAVAASVTALSVVEAPDAGVGISFAAALAVAVAALAATGAALAGLTRRFLPARAAYPVRQGISNLFRPHNQTVSVTVAMGFGAFVVGTVLTVERSLLDDLSLSFGEGRPNVLLFDVQPDQVDGVLELVPSVPAGEADVFPLVPSRLARVNGRSRQDLRADTLAADLPEGWALRREYRNTYRPGLRASEELVAGRWWDGTPGSEDRSFVDAGALFGVSMSTDIVDDLNVGLGDTLTWEVAGVEIPTVVTSLRRVDWSRLEPNFYAVLEPGALDGAPHTAVVLARVPDAGERERLQLHVVEAFPNVSVLDFSRVQEAVDAVLLRVHQAVAFLGGFSALAGLLVLLGALATSRAQRLREGALLRTLGARRGQVLVVLLTEYVAMGTLATVTGLLLAWVAGALLAPGVFEVDFHARPAPLVAVGAAVVALTVVVGLAGSRHLLAHPPLVALREAPE